MKVLSLFDGLGGGRIALDRLGIIPTKYFASEIDKAAIKVAMSNFNDIIQIGDVCNVKGSDLPKIDLLIGGSPCQGFSYNGNQLNLNDDRSKLFFEYLRLFHECKPKYFFLENVEMKFHFKSVISEFLGVAPIYINSADVSAQNRPRLYWTNLAFDGMLKQNICLKDIIDISAHRRFIEPSNVIHRIFSDNYMQFTLLQGCNFTQENRAYYMHGKHGTLLHSNGHRKAKVLLDNGFIACLTRNEAEKLQTIPVDYTREASFNQAFSMLGNGWTIDVITQFLKHYGKQPSKMMNYQQSLFEWY